MTQTEDYAIITGKPNRCPFFPSLKFLLKIFVTLPTRAQTAGELQSPHIATIQIILLLCIFHPPAQPELALIIYSDYSLCVRANFLTVTYATAF